MLGPWAEGASYGAGDGHETAYAAQQMLNIWAPGASYGSFLDALTAAPAAIGLGQQIEGSIVTKKEKAEAAAERDAERKSEALQGRAAGALQAASDARGSATMVAGLVGVGSLFIVGIGGYFLLRKPAKTNPVALANPLPLLIPIIMGISALAAGGMVAEKAIKTKKEKGKEKAQKKKAKAADRAELQAVEAAEDDLALAEAESAETTRTALLVGAAVVVLGLGSMTLFVMRRRAA
jgi:hypothetical protein